MRTRSKQAKKCPVCQSPMRKNGHDRMGRQRWQCDECRLTAGTRNNTKRRRTQLAEFLDWLLEAAPQRKRPESARNFRKRVDWCWRLEPRIEPDGVVHRVVMADGTYVNGGAC
ncbi:IS1/IS1595 family N-terminal zinc-binding domain-containing protein [Bifidobacterium pseudolongum]|uniref:IS1/IS1595 family N-terminal zinc-binding domain-containing protein n=1 Tax=Bifidobacterium pseudolongum TaxID=1694 RepID=UPI0010206033|nr:hypothetical protein [Bifidobacterium pseudolongum]